MGQLLLGVVRAYRRDQIGYLAGSISFFMILGMVPFLFAATAVAGKVLGEMDATKLFELLRARLPEGFAESVAERAQALQGANHLALFLFGVAVALYSASRAVKAMMRALNLINGVQENRPGWKRALLAMGATVAGVVGWVLALALVLGTLPLARFLPGPLALVIEWLRLPAAALVAMALFSFFYSVLPAQSKQLRWLSEGGVVAVVLWVLASQAFSIYLSRFANLGALYGTFGGLIGFLLWVWMSAQVLLIGAEINAWRVAHPRG